MCKSNLFRFVFDLYARKHSLLKCYIISSCVSGFDNGPSMTYVKEWNIAFYSATVNARDKSIYINTLKRLKLMFLNSSKLPNTLFIKKYIFIRKLASAIMAIMEGRSLKLPVSSAISYFTAQIGDFSRRNIITQRLNYRQQTKFTEIDSKRTSLKIA